MKRMGLKINEDKIKCGVMGKLKESLGEGIIFKLQNDIGLGVEWMSSFIYLGVLITRDESIDNEPSLQKY